MSTPDEKRDIAARNKALEKRGAKSRYVDTKPEHDWTLQGDTHAADAEPAMADVPEHIQRAGERMRQETLKQMAERGLLGGRDKPLPKRLSRRETVIRLLQYQKQLGWGYEKYEKELEALDAKQ